MIAFLDFYRKVNETKLTTNILGKGMKRPIFGKDISGRQEDLNCAASSRKGINDRDRVKSK